MTRPRAFSHEIAGLSNSFLEENWVLDLGWRGGHLKSALGGMERTRVMVFVHADQATVARCKSVAGDPTPIVTPIEICRLVSVASPHSLPAIMGCPLLM